MTAAVAEDVWSRVIGQSAVVEELRAAVADPGAMTHAWLFTGPPGNPHDLADVVDPQGQALGDHGLNVCVRAGQHCAALVARAVTAVRALERRREGTRRHRPTRPRRTGEQPGVGHCGRIGDGSAQLGHDGRLPDDLCPDARGSRHGCSCGVEPVWACG